MPTQIRERTKRRLVLSDDESDLPNKLKEDTLDRHASKRTSPNKTRGKTSKTSKNIPFRSGNRKTGEEKSPGKKSDRSISAFFGTAGRSDSKVEPISLPGLQDSIKGREEDLIEDDILSDGPTGQADNHERLGPQVKATSLGLQRQLERRSLPSSSQIFKLEETASIILNNAADQRNTKPWAEQYGPTNLAELAVNKKKVAEVGAWLDATVHGRHGKRLLILKGPSGSGKTIAIQMLAQSMGLDVTEWRNPISTFGQDREVASMSAQFEDFLGRSARFGKLEFSVDGSESQVKPARTVDVQDIAKGASSRMVLLEEFPNTFQTASPALKSFRSAILEYLISSTMVKTAHRADNDGIIPLVLIITETRLSTSTAVSDSFTAHRLLGPEILAHPRTTVIEFNAIAPTFMTKALDLILLKEARNSGRRRVPGTAMLKELAEIGDVRSAIGALEFLCVGGIDQDQWSGTTAAKRRKGTAQSTTLNETERASLRIVSHRESNLGLFHAVGKVIYNKRDVVENKSEVCYDVPPPQHLPEHVRSCISQVRIEDLIRETGTDTETFVAALHENYVLSCGGTAFSSCVEKCGEALSDADLISDPYGSQSARQGSRLYLASTAERVSHEEIVFHSAVRGLLFNLPYPVKRSSHPERGLARGSKPIDAFKIFYPASMRLYRTIEETSSFVDHWASRLQGAILPDDILGQHEYKNEDDSPISNSPTNKAPTPTSQYAARQTINVTTTQLIMERLPMMRKISTCILTSQEAKDLRTITEFNGLQSPTEDDAEDDPTESTTGAASDWATDWPTDETATLNDKKHIKGKKGVVKSQNLPNTVDAIAGSTLDGMDNLYLADDDIEDD